MSAYREAPDATSLTHAVAALWVGETSRELLGPCTLVQLDASVVALASTRTLERARGRPVLVGAALDGSDAVPARTPIMARYVGLRVLALPEGALPWPTLDVTPARSAALGGLEAWRSATALDAIGLVPDGRGCRRVRVPVAPFELTLASRMGAGDERTQLRASACEVPPAAWLVDGAPLIARWSASRLLGTPAQARIVAFACTAGVETLYSPPGAPPTWAELVPVDGSLWT